MVDDDISNLKMAGHILSKANMRVTALKSGKALLDYIAGGNTPDEIAAAKAKLVGLVRERAPKAEAILRD